ncbi:WD and tetratricopeptide repeat-containing protein [Clohesyomyces aquaticus]|uniref:WD and tetratricopeptide repeat-containing protein n=1 Tax=Clohesyomyces aquaticus TaxID=1231657 RepID=A0A1Y1YK95_9PLEO|nr:WD and tetratricopeptide repeat-containing protein [Clohesyomyces aquaticus]
MKYTVYDRLLRREMDQDRKRYSNVRAIYGDRQWVEDMDIVNELEGHNGCVNALCWSRSGLLLASGSDDHRINIHAYHPESSTSQFNLTTSIVTGHTSNIFSVKFMPYSNDRTIVSATDDVRIFDIEYSGHSALGSSSSRRRGVGIHGVTNGMTLTQGDTNAKAFRSHSDTVKRIVTEDNPFYFLTCSEDGDVRQWDIRQPAKTYPPVRGSMPHWAVDSEASDNVPPPLISYSRYHLDLNTVSCSPSQPHYIALGGAHLHCFLHDRRMLGRDKLRERGTRLSGPGNWSDHDDELLGKATQCVRKFAPNGQKRMRRGDNGHITACKISDANPNEMVVSWSGDWIYSFDLLRSPDASEETTQTKVTNGSQKHRVRDADRKRKRTKSTLISEEAAERTSSRQRTESSQGSVSDFHEHLSLRVNYGNGQSEEIRIERPAQPQSSGSETQHENAAATEHYRIAKTALGIREQMFCLNPAKPAGVSDGPSGHKDHFTSVLGFAASILPDVDEISRTWRYPLNPGEVDVAIQNTLRDGRAAFRRFVQAAGTLARVLGGQLHTGGNANATISRYFTSIQQPAPNERPLPQHEQFGYDFLKAILLWLDSGLGTLVEGFSSGGNNPRLPIRPDADVEAVEQDLIPYLLQIASDDPVVDMDVSRFEKDDTRILYSSEKAAVMAFARALETPFADLSGSSSSQDEVQDRQTAISQWAFKVGRGILFNASKEIKFKFVDRAFGGLGLADPTIRAEEAALREQQEDIDPVEEDDVVADAEMVSRAWAEQPSEPSPGPSGSSDPTHSTQRSPSASALHPMTRAVLEELPGDDPVQREAVRAALVEYDSELGEEDDDSDGDIDPEEADEGDEDQDVDEHGLSRTRSGRILWRSDFDRSHQRERVESDVPCSAHTRTYTGHCNVRTVKDVNYFGLQDEYVVSGSDSGHVFIWDRKTSQLLNILEGDGETVNVVQGHPYEPTMAVSGIDHTIKIFSPDIQEQHNARKGIGVYSVDPGFSTLGYSRRRRNRNNPPREPVKSDESSRQTQEGSDDEEVAPNGLSSKKRMHEQYQITSQNDMERKGGRENAFITRALLAQLAQRIHAHQHMGGGGDGDEDGDGEGSILINSDEACTLM